MLNPGATCSAFCFLLLWTSPGVTYWIPVFPFMMNKCNVACIRVFGNKYSLYREAYSYLSETTPAEQTEAPWAGENMSPSNLLQTKYSNVHVLLLMPCSQAIRHPKKTREERPSDVEIKVRYTIRVRDTHTQPHKLKLINCKIMPMIYVRH